MTFLITIGSIILYLCIGSLIGRTAGENPKAREFVHKTMDIRISSEDDKAVIRGWCTLIWPVFTTTVLIFIGYDGLTYLLDYRYKRKKKTKKKD